jgi:HEAT repeat protein
MLKAAKYRLLICLATFCLCFLLFTPITKTAWPQDETEIQTLINKLKNPNSDIRLSAAEALSKIGPAAIPALIKTFKDENDNVRKYAAEALGKIGPAAVPALVEALKDQDKYVRKYAAYALRRIDSVAKTAVPVLIQALSDSDAEVRQQATWALGTFGSEAKAAVPALIEALKDEKGIVRDYAAWALGMIGPEAKSVVPALIEALKDENKDVRDSAVQALREIGPEASSAVQGLVRTLKDETVFVRSLSAEALGEIGPKAKSAVPALIEALKDKDVRKQAAEALGKIATALRDAKVTDTIKDLKAAKKALSAYPEFEDEKDQVRRAIEYLEQIKPPLWKIVWNLVKENILISSLILAYVLWIIAWLITFWLRPLALLLINQALKPYDFKLPDKLGAIQLPLRFLLFVGFLNYHPRVLDAWVKAHISTCREKFSKKDTVQDRKVHISVPVEFDRQTIPDLTAIQLHPTFARQIGCLLIQGEGGSGKTSLACQIAKWAMSEDKEPRLCDHLMLPVLIEQEFSSKEDPSAFIDAVNRQVQDLTDQADPIPEELLGHLLRKRRVLVIVDHLSEMSKDTRDQIQPEKKGFPANALIVTSRLEENLGGVSKTIIKPLRIKRERLSPFLESYLTHRDKSNLFTDSVFFDACRRLSEMVGDRDITLLLAKLYAEQLIAAKEGVTDEKLPDNIPDLMLSYINDLNRSITEEKINDQLVHQSAKALAWHCLKDTYRPAPVRVEDALVVLNLATGPAHIEYLEHRLRLIRTIPPAKDRLEFVLDPLAEYLSGLHLVELYGEQEEDWNKFLSNADSQEGSPEAIKGFLLAVRDCCIAKGQEAKIPDFVADDLAKRAGMDIEAINRAQKEQRIQRLINQLSVPEAEDRISAVGVLGRIGSDAEAAVPILAETLRDKDEKVRGFAAMALGKIGPEAKAAVPALIEALKDEDKNVRRHASFALEKINTPEALKALEEYKQKSN